MADLVIGREEAEPASAVHITCLVITGDTTLGRPSQEYMISRVGFSQPRMQRHRQLILPILSRAIGPNVLLLA